MTTRNWFEVDKAGLAQLLERKGRAFVVTELIQNAWDQNVTEVHITLEPIPGRRAARLIVTDDDPNGFADLSHAFTLFASSTKKTDPTKRGRFNLGEKLVLAMCDEAEITSTTGTVRFDREGRHTSRAKRLCGSEFKAVVRMTRDDIVEVASCVRFLIPPASVATWFNGIVIPQRTPITEFEATLETEIADDEGQLRRRHRKSTVRVYEPLSGETPSIYEMGIPVVETGDRWHYDVGQKVPLTMDRDNVPPGYLRTLRTFVFNALHEKTSAEEMRRPWVQDALRNESVAPTAVVAAKVGMFGEKAVIYDPSDPEANKRAASEGYTVIPGGALDRDQWHNIRKADAARPAGQVTPSPKPYSPNGSPLTLVPPDDWTPGMQRIVGYAKWLAEEILGTAITVQIARETTWPYAATYGPGHLVLNLGRLGHQFFNDGITEAVDELLIHEFGHHYASDHRSADYHRALCRLGAKLKQLAISKLGVMCAHIQQLGNGSTD